MVEVDVVCTYGFTNLHLLELCRNPIWPMQACVGQLGFRRECHLLGYAKDHKLRLGRRRYASFRSFSRNCSLTRCRHLCRHGLDPISYANQTYLHPPSFEIRKDAHRVLDGPRSRSNRCRRCEDDHVHQLWLRRPHASNHRPIHVCKTGGDCRHHRIVLATSEVHRPELLEEYGYS